MLVSDARARSKRKGLPPPEISGQTVEAVLRAGRCQATQLPFDLSPGPRPGVPNTWAPTLARIDASKGFTIANTRVVVYAYTQAKSFATYHELITSALEESA